MQISKFLKWFFLGQGSNWRKAIDEAKEYASKQQIDPRIIRERIKDEDSLLNSRTNIFLVVNGIGFVAIGLDKFVALNSAALCLLMSLIDLIWFLCSRQSIKLLSALTKLLRFVDPEDSVEGLVQDLLGRRWKHWIRPTTILAVYLPILKILVWITLVVVIILKSP
jgi:hypothetical protein